MELYSLISSTIILFSAFAVLIFFSFYLIFRIRKHFNLHTAKEAVSEANNNKDCGSLIADAVVDDNMFMERYKKEKGKYGRFQIVNKKSLTFHKENGKAAYVEDYIDEIIEEKKIDSGSVLYHIILN